MSTEWSYGGRKPPRCSLARFVTIWGGHGGIPVRAENFGFSSVTKTDPQGNFALGVTDGTWRVATMNDELARLGLLGNQIAVVLNVGEAMQTTSLCGALKPTAGPGDR